MHCNHCGAPQPSQRLPLCSRCGQALDATAMMERIGGVEAQSIGSLPSWTRGDQPRLVVVRGPNRGSSFMVRDLTILGRRDDCHIILDDLSVSRRHAMAAPDGAGLMIEDLGSLNGTFVDDRRIEQATTVKHGQSLLVGRYRLIVVGAAYDDDPGATTA